jgi:hypothetical protein
VSDGRLGAKPIVHPARTRAEADVRLLEVVRKVLVEATDVDQRIPPERAVAAGIPRTHRPALRRRAGLAIGLTEELNAVVRRRTAVEFECSVSSDTPAAARAEAIVREKRLDHPREPIGCSGRASSSMKTTMSPDAAAIAMLRERLRFASGHSAILIREPRSRVPLRSRRARVRSRRRPRSARR